jgi:hypothetical protein
MAKSAGRCSHDQISPTARPGRDARSRRIQRVGANVLRGAGYRADSGVWRPCPQPRTGISELSALGRRKGKNARRHGRRSLSTLQSVAGQAGRPRAGRHQSPASRPCLRPAGTTLAEPSITQGTAADRRSLRRIFRPSSRACSTRRTARFRSWGPRWAGRATACFST